MAVGCALVVFCLGSKAISQTAAPAPAPADAAASSRLVEVRLALSEAATRAISPPFLRLLLENEFGDAAVLAPSATGPLGDDVAYIWVDVEPSTKALTVEVRLGTKPVQRRTLVSVDVGDDFAARVVAIAAAEILRDQMRPVRPPRKPPPPKPPTEAEIEMATRDLDAFAWSPRVVGAWIPSPGAFFFGAAMDLGFRRFGASAHVGGTWMTGPLDVGIGRWLEANIGIEYRLWAKPWFRVGFGANAGLGVLHVRGATIDGEVSGAPATVDTWSGRAAAALLLEWRVARPVWLSIGLEPGAILRPVMMTASANGSKSPWEGFWLGLRLGLTFEQRQIPATPAARSNGTP